MNIPNDTMASKIITCNYGSNVHNEAIAGNLVAGTFLLVGYRRNDYANVTAYSYWKGNAMSIATIENNVWAKRFDKVITNTDLQTRIKPIEVNGYSGQTFKSVLKDKCDNSINFVVFRSNASNPITDNPFSFVNGYAIVFNSIALAPSNSLMILGTSDGNNAVIESRRLDLR